MPFPQIILVIRSNPHYTFLYINEPEGGDQRHEKDIGNSTLFIVGVLPFF